MITTEKDLAEELKKNKNFIEIEGDLAKKIIRIKAAGNVAWAIAIGAVAIAVISIPSAPATGGASLAVNLFAAPAAITAIGGISIFSSLVALAAAGGGVHVLKKLRGYKIEKIHDKKIKLIK